MRILATTTSFFDTPGRHQERLQQTGYNVVTSRGPHSEAQLLELVGDGSMYDGYLCGEDEFTVQVIEKIKDKAKIISKYGVGLDRVDLEAAQKYGISVTNTPGVNHATVAELTFGLLLGLVRNIPEENAVVHRGEWRRFTGVELDGKTMGVFGFGRVGREVARRAMAFGMNVIVYNTSWSPQLEESMQSVQSAFNHPLFGTPPPKITRYEEDELALQHCDFVSLHMNLTKNNQSYMNRRRIYACKKGAYILNVSRGALVDQLAMSQAIKNGHIAGYGADVLAQEPVTLDNPLIGMQRVIITPHIGSRTRESVERQGIAAVENLVKSLGEVVQKES